MALTIWLVVNQETVPAVMPKHCISMLVPSVSLSASPRAVKKGMKIIPPPAPVELATIAPKTPSIKK